MSQTSIHNAPDIKMEEGNGHKLNGHGNNNLVEEDRNEMLQRLRSTASVQMSPELFEKLYLTPHSNVKGDLRKTFANPTPIALVGFLLALTPLSCDLMGWRGAGGGGAASIGVYYFMGGLLMLVGGILEWVLGNSFSACVFSSFAGFWFSYGATLTPAFATFASYAPADAASPAEGLQTTGFNASLGFWFLFMGVLCFIFLVCALRTNIVFVVIFLTLLIAFILLTVAYWAMAADFTANAALTNRCLTGAGASTFVTCLAGWYLLTSIMLAIVDFPLDLPVGDLSTIIKGKSERHA